METRAEVTRKVSAKIRAKRDWAARQSEQHSANKGLRPATPEDWATLFRKILETHQSGITFNRMVDVAKALANQYGFDTIDMYSSDIRNGFRLGLPLLVPTGEVTSVAGKYFLVKHDKYVSKTSMTNLSDTNGKGIEDSQPPKNIPSGITQAIGAMPGHRGYKRAAVVWFLHCFPRGAHFQEIFSWAMGNHTYVTSPTGQRKLAIALRQIIQALKAEKSIEQTAKFGPFKATLKGRVTHLVKLDAANLDKMHPKFGFLFEPVTLTPVPSSLQAADKLGVEESQAETVVSESPGEPADDLKVEPAVVAKPTSRRRLSTSQAEGLEDWDENCILEVLDDKASTTECGADEEGLVEALVKKYPWDDEAVSGLVYSTVSRFEDLGLIVKDPEFNVFYLTEEGERQLSIFKRQQRSGK